MWNYPIESETAKKFWASKHKCNRMKALVAFSTDVDNFYQMAKRYGIKRAWRERAWEAFGHYVNYPLMDGIPFSELNETYWDCMPLDLGTGPIPARALLTDTGEVLRDENGNVLLHDLETEDPMKLLDYMPNNNVKSAGVTVDQPTLTDAITLTTPPLPAGTYAFTVSFVCDFGSGNDVIQWDVTGDWPSELIFHKEAKATEDVNLEDYTFQKDWAGGVFTSTLRFALASGLGPTEITGCGIYLKRVG